MSLRNDIINYMKQVYQKTDSTKLNERVARLEVGVISLCDAVDAIRNNELVHINTKIDKLDERFDSLDKKVDGLAVKLGIFFAVITTMGQALLNHFFK